MSSKKQSIILSIAHVYDLIFFYRLLSESNIAERYEIKVLFLQHKYFNDKMHITENIIRKLSDKVKYVKNSHIPRYSLSVLKHIFLSLRFKRILKSAFKKEDIVLILDKSSFTSNIIFNYFDRVILFQFHNNNKDRFNYRTYFQKNALIFGYHKILNLHNIKVLRLRNSEKLIEKYLVDLEKIKILTISDTKNHESICFSNVASSSNEKKSCNIWQ